jgi:phage protein U
MPGGKLTLLPSYGAPLTLIVMASPDRAGGVGGWEASERAEQRPGKWWKGQPDDTMSWEFLVDIDMEFAGLSVEKRLSILRLMGVKHAGQDEPPSIKLDGDVTPADASLTWVIEDIQYTDRLYQGDGTLQQQKVTVTFTRYNAIDEVSAIRIRSTRVKGRKKRHHVIKTKTGDTLRAVAIRELGNGSRWKEIKTWNPKVLKRVNPDVRLRAGTHLTIR